MPEWTAQVQVLTGLLAIVNPIGAIPVLFGLVSATLWLALRLAVPISEALGPIGVNIVTRLRGLLLVAVGVELIARGLSTLFPSAARGGP